MPICGSIHCCLLHAFLILDSFAAGQAHNPPNVQTVRWVVNPAEHRQNGVDKPASALTPCGELCNLRAANLVQQSAGKGSSQRARDGSGGFWVYMVAIVVVLLLAVLLAIWYWRKSRATDAAAGASAWGRSPSKAGTASSKPRSSTTSSRPSRSHGEGRSSGSSVRRSSTTAPSSEDRLAARGGHAPTPLCPLLIVPEGTRLACVVQNDVCRKRQDLSFNVRGMQSRGGAALFQMRVSEHGGSGQGIYVETLGGKEQLAFLSTEDLWRGAPRPLLSILQPWGEAYGSIQKAESGEYVVRREQAEMWVFSGDFAKHSVQVVSTGGEPVASVCPGSPEEYQVFVHARIDAGLLVLGLLAIDKCESEP